MDLVNILSLLQEDALSPRGGGGRRLVTQRSTSFRLRKRNNSFRLRRKRMLPGFFFDLFGDPAEQVKLYN